MTTYGDLMEGSDKALFLEWLHAEMKIRKTREVQPNGSKPEVNSQGKAIVDTYSNGYYLMLPDGVVNWYTSKTAINKAVKAWSKANSESDKINVCQIEWR